MAPIVGRILGFAHTYIYNIYPKNIETVFGDYINQ